MVVRRREDTVPAGSAAKGFTAAGFNVAGTNYPLIKDIEKHVHAKGKGNMEDKSRVGGVYYNRGVVSGIITVEAIRKAQEKYGQGKALTGEQMRWGFENLNMDAKHLASIGATGFMPRCRSPPRPRGLGQGQVPAMGRQQVEGADRLGRFRQASGARHDRGVGGRIRQEKGSPRDCSKEM